MKELSVKINELEPVIEYDGLKIAISKVKRIVYLWNDYCDNYELWLILECEKCIEQFNHYLLKSISVKQLMQFAKVVTAKRFYHDMDLLIIDKVCQEYTEPHDNSYIPIIIKPALVEKDHYNLLASSQSDNKYTQSKEDRLEVSNYTVFSRNKADEIPVFSESKELLENLSSGINYPELHEECESDQVIIGKSNSVGSKKIIAKYVSKKDNLDNKEYLKAA